MQLTIDMDLQRAAEEGFKAGGFNGAAVVMDPRTGEVLAFTSRPGYDPNDFAAGIDRATWAGLNTDPLKPLQNRAIQGRYSPGSTFKIVVEVAALEEGIITPDFRVFCGGSASFFGRPFQCWKRGGHGSVDMRHALEQSCNVYHYTMGNMVGVDKIHKWATLLGLGEKTGIDLPNEIEGPRAVDRVEAKAIQREMVRRRNHLRVDWTGAGLDHADFARGDDVDGRQRRHALGATAVEGDRRGQRLEARAAAAAEVAGAVEAGDDRGAARRAVPRRQRRRHRRARTHSRQGRVGQDGHGAGHLAVGRQEGRRPHRARPSRSRLVRLFRAARQSRNRRVSFSASTTSTAATSAPIAKYVMETYFAKKDGQPLPKLSMPAPEPDLERDEPAVQELAAPVVQANPGGRSGRAGGN